MSEKHQGLKAVALLESTKGIISLLLGLGLHHFAGDSLQQLLLDLLQHLHLNPASYWPEKLLHQAGLLTHFNLNWVAAGALVYGAIRLIEAYGLWHNLLWTEWFALLSGAIYLPFELYELLTHPGWLSIATLLINLIIVFYMYRVVRAKPKHEQDAE
ncbi:DUF2127 domain-containing protein [Vibrio metoecus]|uniref:DUF2127 domain-containing protein n=1 Tax=Vibrio metoecus TaxID=1481663 RepID=UPI0006D7A54A|nr:DUF2127 domain-containing protein [Vibrio metoecus]KQB07264.1 membrane protein [Vibrio metoecus]PAR51066.1 DUF2127 domain-containing protein [Vibrio metoecus]